MLDRKNIDPKYKWDLTKIYPTEDDFKADYAEVEAIVKRFPAHEKTMTKSPKGLLAGLLDEAKLEYIIADKDVTVTADKELKGTDSYPVYIVKHGRV